MHQCTSMRKSTHLFTKLHIAVLLQIQTDRSIFSIPSAVNALQPGLLFAMISDKHCFCLMSADLCQCSGIDQVIASRFCVGLSQGCVTRHTLPPLRLSSYPSPLRLGQAPTQWPRTATPIDRSLAHSFVHSFAKRQLRPRGIIGGFAGTLYGRV